MQPLLDCQTDVWKFVNRAIKDGDEQRLLNQLLRQPELARMADTTGETILYKACAYQFSKRIVYTLLQQGSNPGFATYAQRIVPIWQVCNERYPDEVILTLLGYGPEMDLKQKNSVRNSFVLKHFEAFALVLVWANSTSQVGKQRGKEGNSRQGEGEGRLQTACSKTVERLPLQRVVGEWRAFRRGG